MPGIDILVNVDIFSEGFDVPEVEFIQLARPTLSLSKYLQQVGRGMRVAEGKNEVIVLDQVGLYLMFSLPTSDRNWQSTFLGRTSGKGQMLKQKDIMLYGVGDYKSLSTEKWLVNEQMFRIKSVVRSTSIIDHSTFLPCKRPSCVPSLASDLWSSAAEWTI